MSTKSRKNWTQPELVKVLALYCQLAFGQMHSKFPAVKALAEQIKRSPSAVALKLVNFASFDPTLHARGIKGMRNASALDREVWSQYFGDWAILAESYPLSFPELSEETQFPVTTAAETEVERTYKARLGQQFFRNAVVAAYRFKCCVTGITAPALIRAGHIKPWAVSPEVRLDPRNGLCLNILHDSAFDRGFMTLDSNLNVVLSNRLKQQMPELVFQQMFGVYENRPISLPEKFVPHEACLAYHRIYVFQD